MLELNKIHNGNCLDLLKQLDDNSVDSIVTDPPYELGFMGKNWDSTGIAYNVELWKECLRVLKPGGHLLAFGGTRTYHRMVCAIEDVGFEIRDQIQWIYGSGFPKSMDISKAIDKKFGAEREVVGIGKGAGKNPKGLKFDDSSQSGGHLKSEYELTKPATEEAKQWNGFGTALKPANEPIVVARKPLSEKTVIENVLKWGTGGINIDECRVEYQSEADLNQVKAKCNFTENSKSIGFGTDKTLYGNGITPLEQARDCVKEQGRFPANVIFDEESGKLLDEQSGITKSGKVKLDKESYKGESNTGFLRGRSTSQNQHGNSGGVSRFFYCAKASKKERGESNNHPTVKPLSLMQYLVKLVTPPNGIVLDPFAGSGTTCIACIKEDFNYIGFELEKSYIEISNKRIKELS